MSNKFDCIEKFSPLIYLASKFFLIGHLRNIMTSFSEIAIPLTLFFVSSAICKSIEIGNETVFNIEDMNQINLIQPDISQKIFNVSNSEVNIQSNEIQGTQFILKLRQSGFF